MRSVALLFCLLATLSAGSVLADPENILVEGYTFVRPKAWVWQPADKSSAVNRFVVPGKTTDTRTDVRFYVFPQTEEQIHDRLLNNFDKGAISKETHVKIGEKRLTYLTVSGKAAQKLKNVPRNTELKAIGVCLPTSSASKQLLVRIYGPVAEVDSATEEFNKMVEVAVEEMNK